MITKEEYEKTYIRMMDSMRKKSKGKHNCNGVSCDENCPLHTYCMLDSKGFNVFKAIEIVEQWGKEHPIVTRADMFEKVFGHRPMDANNYYVCPQRVGIEVDDCNNKLCYSCVKSFWDGEYIAPKKENE